MGGVKAKPNIHCLQEIHFKYKDTWVKNKKTGKNILYEH